MCPLVLHLDVRSGLEAWTTPARSTKSRNRNRQTAGCDGAENSTHCAPCMLQSPWTYYCCNWVASGAVFGCICFFFLPSLHWEETRRWRVRAVNSASERHPVAVWRPKYMFWASSYGISVVIVACDSKSISVLLSFDIEGYTQCESYYLATAMDLFAFTFFEMLIRCPLSLQDTNTLKEKKKMGLKTDTCVSLVLAAAARVACWGLATQLLLLAAKVWCLLRAAQKPRWGKMDRGPLGKSWVESNKPSFGLAPLGSSCGHWMFADDRADRAHCALHYAQWLLCKKTLHPCPWPEVPGFSQTVRLSNFFHGKTYPYAICC